MLPWIIDLTASGLSRRSTVAKSAGWLAVCYLPERTRYVVCAAAFGFYAEVLGGKITAAIPYGDAPPGMPISDPKYKSWLMHCWLEVGDQAIMGADMDLGWAPNIDKPKNGFDVTLHTASVEEARRWFDQLSADGKVSMPFGESFWSPGFGGLIDKFGVPWMINTIPQEGWKPNG